MDVMLPVLLRDADVGLLLVRRTPTHLAVVDANRTAAGLCDAAAHDLCGPVVSSMGLGRLVPLVDAVERALRGEKSQWCTLLNTDGLRVRHLNVCVSPFDGAPPRLALVQLSHLSRRHDECPDLVTAQ